MREAVSPPSSIPSKKLIQKEQEKDKKIAYINKFKLGGIIIPTQENYKNKTINKISLPNNKFKSKFKSRNIVKSKVGDLMSSTNTKNKMHYSRSSYNLSSKVP